MIHGYLAEFGRVAALVLVLLLPSLAWAEEAARMDCFEACDSKMEHCLDHCPRDKDGNPIEICRNDCAKHAFHPCLNACPNPRTGLTKQQKKAMEEEAAMQKEVGQ